MSVARKTFKRAKTGIKLALRSLIQNVALPPRSLTPGNWNLVDSAQGLRLRGMPLAEMLSQWGSPLHVVDAEALRANARKFLTPHGKPGGCEVYYSYKTNPIPGVLQLLHGEGVGAEVISHYELWLALQLGMPPERILFNGPGKSVASIRQAVELGLQIININHLEEIEHIAKVAQELGRRPRVGLRVTTGDGWTNQFGSPIAGGMAYAAFKRALDTGVLDVVGVHAHLGGMIHSEVTLLRAVNGVLDFVEQMEAALGLSLEILNFGGSLATPTVHHISAMDQRLNQTFHRELPEPDPLHSLAIEDYVTALAHCVKARYQRRSKPVPRIMIEPGRSMTGNTQMLVASVINSKQEAHNHFLILDAGINLAESVRNEYHQIFPVKGWSEPRTETYTLVGPICSPGDTLIHAWRSRRLAAGDAVVIMDAGSYFVPFSTSFSYPRPAIIMIDNGQPVLLRRAEQFSDLISHDQSANAAL